jgi:hypothetical protein
MPKIKKYKQIEIQPQIVAESRTPYGMRTYPKMSIRLSSESCCNF